MLRKAAPVVEEEVEPAPARILPLHRPPGAVAESDFLAHCSRCGDCIQACPHQAIVAAPARFREAAGSPIIVASDNPCLYCEDKPCILACKSGVLSLENPTKMGTAMVQVMDCLAWQRSFCTVCEERCPVPGAITLEEGKPTVQSSSCTGCGVCLHVCPAPRKAILLLPEMRRPPWKATSDE